MTHVETFDSTEEMIDAIRKRADAAHDSLSPLQSALSWGDHWVQFHDIDNGHLIWGRIETRIEIMLGEIVDSDMVTREGVTFEEVLTTVEQIEAGLARGFMYGRAYDRFNISGELGTTHKAHVWPIEEPTFEAARRAGWDHREITDERARFGLDLAFRSMRAHVTSLGEQS